LNKGSLEALIGKEDTTVGEQRIKKSNIYKNGGRERGSANKKSAKVRFRMERAADSLKNQLEWISACRTFDGVR
jgi:hypothetical protein